MRKVASLLKQKNDFTWPGEPNTTCMARGLYFALPTMKNSFSSSSVVVIIMLREEYLVECQKRRISLSSFAAVTTSFSFLSSSLVLHSWTYTFSDSAQGLFCKYMHCWLFHAGDPLLPFLKVHLVRRFFIELLPLVQFPAFLGKFSSYLAQSGHLIKIHEDYKNPNSKWNISLQ